MELHRSFAFATRPISMATGPRTWAWLIPIPTTSRCSWTSRTVPAIFRHPSTIPVGNATAGPLVSAVVHRRYSLNEHRLAVEARSPRVLYCFEWTRLGVDAVKHHERR